MSGMLSPILGALVTVLAALAFGLLVFHKLESRYAASSDIRWPSSLEAPASAW